MPIDPTANVSPTARVAAGAVIGAGAVVGDFCVIEDDVVVGAGCVLEPYVFLKRWTTLGEGNEISAGAALGTDPFDKNFTGARSYLHIGDRNKIREHFTISRGTAPESVTEIGSGNYIMSSGHIAHNCRVGDNNVIASCALLAGYVEVGSGAFISGNVAVHQFCKIGSLAMIAGNTGVSNDVPPFITCAGYRGNFSGLNLVGMKRAGMSREQIQAVKDVYRILYRSGLKKTEALETIEAAGGVEASLIAAFVRSSRRGICR